MVDLVPSWSDCTCDTRTTLIYFHPCRSECILWYSCNEVCADRFERLRGKWVKNWRIYLKITTFDKNLGWSIGGAVTRQFRSWLPYGIICSRLGINCRLCGICSMLWRSGGHDNIRVWRELMGAKQGKEREATLGYYSSSAPPNAVFNHVPVTTSSAMLYLGINAWELNGIFVCIVER